MNFLFPNIIYERLYKMHKKILRWWEISLVILKY